MSQSNMPTSLLPARPRTWPDVAHKFIEEMPFLLASVAVIVLALMGKFSEMQFLVGIFGSLLARSLPKPLAQVSAGAVALVVLGTSLQACVAAKPIEADATYLGQQLACVDKAHTIPESRTCRDWVDARWGVEPRTVIVDAKDGGE